VSRKIRMKNRYRAIKIFWKDWAKSSENADHLSVSFLR
jgi:hypothetical protein